MGSTASILSIPPYVRFSPVSVRESRHRALDQLSVVEADTSLDFGATPSVVARRAGGDPAAGSGRLLIAALCQLPRRPNEREGSAGCTRLVSQTESLAQSR